MEKHVNPCVVGYSDAVGNVCRDGSSQGCFLIFCGLRPDAESRSTCLTAGVGLIVAYQSLVGVRAPQKCKPTAKLKES
eukprot:5491768-Pyramimonas_sp.AAC.1